MGASAYQELEAVLRQVLVLRTANSSPAAIDAMLGVASDLWSEVPPADKPTQWPADLAAIARELGFAASAEVDTSKLQELASAIDQAIVAVGGIGNVHVSCSPDRIVISGIAGDEDARDEALIAAAKLAPGMQIEDAIDVA